MIELKKPTGADEEESRIFNTKSSPEVVFVSEACGILSTGEQIKGTRQWITNLQPTKPT